MNPRYPIYIVSKGRWESRLTARALEDTRVPYRIVVEPQEFDSYAAVIDPAKILVLPFSNLGLGSIPARNWIWEHSISEGAERHWILDDNIRRFRRFHNSQRIQVLDGTPFRVVEDFADRYTNVAIAGMHYTFFAAVTPTSKIRRPFIANTRVYSNLLIMNKITHRWRGRYNEDTDLCIRVLKDGWCTLLVRAFLADKVETMAMTGGNTDELYKDDGRLRMALSLQQQHPDVVTVKWKWGRPQHKVDYRPFARNRLILREGVVIPDEPNEYGLVLKRTAGSVGRGCRVPFGVEAGAGGSTGGVEG
jgi:hypothetical protein